MTPFGRARVAIFLLVVEAVVIAIAVNACGLARISGLAAPMEFPNKQGEPSAIPAGLVVLLCALYVAGSLLAAIYLLRRRS